jgi:hypothetical protein
MTHDEEHTYRAFLADRRERLRKLYATMREHGKTMQKHGWVKWQDKGQGYCWGDASWRSMKERTVIKQLLALQTNVQQQAMLLLEMEHSIDCEAQKEVA